MQPNPLRAIALIAALAALVLAATAWADTGPDSSQTGTTPSADNGGTAAGRPPAVEDSGGVAGPSVKKRARAAQQPAQEEEPPQLEETPPEDEETPSDDTGDEPGTDTTEAPDDSAQAPAGPAGGSRGGGGGLPTTGLEIGAITAVGLGLLLAGLALRRRPTT
jgi:hypothetical protein